jgi:hypothetical protein
MRKLGISRAVLLSAAFFVPAAGAGWEVAYESGAVALSNLNFKNWPVGYCVGYEDRSYGNAGPD